MWVPGGLRSSERHQELARDPGYRVLLVAMTPAQVAPPGFRAPGEEAALVTRLKAGEDGAFEELVRQHGPRMYAVALRYLSQEADAQDALQDALLSAYRGIGGFSGDSRLGTWLHRVTVNAALMRIRSRARRHEESAESAAFDEAASRESGEVPAANPSDALSRAEMRQRVRLAIARLPEIYRTVLMLRDIEGIELKEIGVLLGIGLSTVKIRLHRGRHVLRQLLASARQEARR